MGLVMLDKNSMKELERNEMSSITLFKKNALSPSLSFKTFLLQIMIKHRYLIINYYRLYVADLTIVFTNASYSRRGHIQRDSVSLPRQISPRFRKPRSETGTLHDNNTVSRGMDVNNTNLRSAYLFARFTI